MLSPIMTKPKKLKIVKLGSNSVDYVGEWTYSELTINKTVTINIADYISNYNSLDLTNDNFIIGLNSIYSSYGDSIAKVNSVTHSYSNGILTININYSYLYGGKYTFNFSAYCAYLE